MIAERRIWWFALALCGLGLVGCIGVGLWLGGVSWQAGRRPTTAPAVEGDPQTRAAQAEAELLVNEQAVAFAGAVVFMALIVLLILLGRRLEPAEPPRDSDSTDLWRRSVPPADDTEALEDQWRAKPPPAPHDN
jgi:hypothetical protein